MLLRPKYSLNELLDHVEELRVFPDVAVRVNEVIRKPGTGIREMSSAVSMDPVLSGRLLKVANSPFYGLPRPASSVERAVQIIGFHSTRDLALALAMSGMGSGRTEEAAEVWTHTLYTAVAMRHMARYVRGLDRDEAFITGLMHDLGVLILLSVEAEAYVPLHHSFSSQGALLARAEQVQFGFDHAALGAACLQRWRLADGIVAAVAGHHQDCLPEVARRSKVLAALHVASDLVRAVGRGGEDQAAQVGAVHPLSATLRIPQAAWGIIAHAIVEDGDEMIEMMS
ncbi:MAG: HDOD domain-containing protein [Deltaproteobacteria bacterium]|nr:HDOD domain-containing protein [Deltaproteobacteria bacterium]